MGVTRIRASQAMPFSVPVLLVMCVVGGKGSWCTCAWSFGSSSFVKKWWPIWLVPILRVGGLGQNGNAENEHLQPLLIP
jgi:hypothetical protein